MFPAIQRKLRNRIGDQQALAAIVLRKRKVVAVGFNSYTKTHPQQAKFAQKLGQVKKIFLHAEIDALSKAPKDSDTIVVLRVNKKGELCCAKPCEICRAAITQFGIKKIFHS